MDNKENRISDALILLSRENYWDAIKIVYDILINEAFQYGTKELNHKQYDLEAQGKEILLLLCNYLKSNQVANVPDVISELHLLTIYFNNFSREALSSKVKNNKVKVLTMNLIGLLNFLNDKKGSEATYYFGKIDTNLKKEIQNNLTEEIFAATSPYFDLWLLSTETFGKDFWTDLILFDPANHPQSVFLEEEFFNLSRYKDLIDTHQLEVKKGIRDEIEEIWGTSLEFAEITNKVISQYHILSLFEEFDNFRRADKSSNKYGKNVYTKEKEEAFHKNIYPYLCGKERYDLVFSEFTTGNQRYDILIYDAKISLSAIVELKVNELKDINANIQQLVNYLDEVEDKPYHYIESPTVGVLLTYYIGKEKLRDIDLVVEASDYEDMVKLTHNFYLLKPNEDRDKPILIGLYNGKE